MKIIMVFAFLATLFCSCDPYYNVEYRVVNQTEFDLEIVSSVLYPHGLDTNLMSNLMTITIEGFSGLGSTTDEYLEEKKSLPFDTLIITTHHGNVCKLDPLDPENWTRSFPDKSQGLGFFELQLNEFDF